jgi:ribosome maturation factor RimP
MEVYMKIEDKVRELIESVIEENGFKLDQVEYVKEGRTYFLRIIIDKDGIVDVEDTVKVFHLINPILDKNDPVNEAYILDVCSKEKGRE